MNLVRWAEEDNMEPAFEDIAFSRAIEEGNGTDLIEREEIFELLENRRRPSNSKEGIAGGNQDQERTT